MSNEPICPKCGGAMERGFVLDRTSGAGNATAETWQDGAPQTSIWSGVKRDSARQHTVETWRCSQCGYLESYAV